MPRTRSKSPPRFTRDAERLIALSLGLNASGSLTEDRFWEARDVGAGGEAARATATTRPSTRALDHLYQTNLGAYDTLIELVENESESLVVMQGDLAWQALLIAVPIVAWSKYSIPSGPIGREDVDALRVQLQGHVLAADARSCSCPTCSRSTSCRATSPSCASSPRASAMRAITGEVPRIDFSRLPETANLLADTRFVIGCAVVPRGKPLFRWQEDASGHAGRAAQPRAVDRAGAPHAREAAARLRVRVPAARRVLRELPRVGPARAPVRRARGRGVPRERAHDQGRGPARRGRGLRRGARRRVPHRLHAARRRRRRARRRVAALRPRGRERAPRPARRGARAARRVRRHRREASSPAPSRPSTARTAARRSSPTPRARSSTPSFPKKPRRTPRTSTKTAGSPLLPAMDALSEVLRAVRLTGAAILNADLRRALGHGGAAPRRALAKGFIAEAETPGRLPPGHLRASAGCVPATTSRCASRRGGGRCSPRATRIGSAATSDAETGPARVPREGADRRRAHSHRSTAETARARAS